MPVDEHGNLHPMSMMKTLHRAILSALSLLSSSTGFAASSSDLALDTRDGPRHALVFRAGDGPQPTVLVLHGALATAAFTARSSGFAEASARHGFTAAFADGLDRQWNDGRTGGHGGPDDVAFLRALVARLVADRIAQPDRVYLAGISNGGMMSFTMACKASELFAGIGTVIANMPAGIEPCALKPMSLVMVNGTADPMVPFDGGGVGLRGGPGSVWSVEKTATLFAQVDACEPAPASQTIAQRDPSQKTSVTRLDWMGCKAGASVTLYRVEGGGHAVAGRRALAGGLLGPSTDDIVAADVIIDAFAADWMTRR